jgi:hypothetical protein
VRLALVGIATGALAGVAAAGDIRSSVARGRVAATVFAEAGAGPALSSPREGYELAARLGVTVRDDCRSLERRLRAGCLEYVDTNAGGAADGLDLPF